MTTLTLRYTLLLSLAIAAGGCAMLSPETCEQFDARRKQINYATEYRIENKGVPPDIQSLGKHEQAAARTYQLHLDGDRVRPCTHLKINKELVLIRRDNPKLILEETREFFADNGKRIAVKNEVLTDQLIQNGRYTASIQLPIPKEAPPGKYRIVSTLTLKLKGSNKATPLAKSSVSFEVTAPKK